jgi:hydroxyethylthiazole kinase-like uncharacterized protein yjeF
MERASLQICKWIYKHYNQNVTIHVFVGPGNNGGDGLAVARLLFEKKYNVHAYLVNEKGSFSKDAETNLKRLKENTKVNLAFINADSEMPIIERNDMVIDALFGSGLTRSLNGLYEKVVRYMNSLTSEVVSIDIPSGLFADNNEKNNLEHVIKATYTLSFQFPKLVFFFADYEEFVGKWYVLPIGLHQDFISSVTTPYFYLSALKLKHEIQTRAKFTHKGTYGHALLIAGKNGMFGAAILASKAALRAGVGLLTTHVPRSGYEIMQISSPESIVSIDESDIIFTEHPNLSPYTSVGVGPGIGTKANSVKAIKQLLHDCQKPMVLDADAINILAENQELIKFLPENTILTPHPKEFNRLAASDERGLQQLKLAQEFAEKHKVIIVLKGAHTAIVNPKKEVWFNSTGNPGMATAGSGDVLTGIILGLLSQDYSPEIACKLGVYWHGLAGDLAIKKSAPESLIASDIIKYLGKALNKIRNLKETSSTNIK